MNERMAGEGGCAVRTDEPRTQRAGRDDGAYCNWDGGDISGTLTARNAGGGQRMPDKQNFMAVIQEARPPRKYIVRRLTPTECARLQGFPDWWTDGVEGSDSAKYKMWGNGIALPCAVDVLGRIADAMREEEQDKSESPADTEPKGSDRSESPAD